MKWIKFLIIFKEIIEKYILIKIEESKKRINKTNNFILKILRDKIHNIVHLVN